MSPSRLRKRITRALMVSWREQPTRYDIEALQANTRRVGLVIKMRWALVLVLALYSVVANWVYAQALPTEQLAHLMVVPAGALLFVVFYNSFYMLTYRRLGNIAFLNHLQLVFDAFVAAVLVYYSGGINSWFWSIYVLLVFEGAFILPSARSTWLLAGICAALLGAVVWGQYFGVLSTVTIPFASDELNQSATFVSVRYLWQFAVIAGSAAISTLMVASLRAREQQLAVSSIVDDATGLYNRAYFHRALHTELTRAERDGRTLFLLLADIDHLNEFNRKFGIDRGDRLLVEIGGRLRNVVSQGTDPLLSANVVARYGGEEFAVLLSESAEGTPLVKERAFEEADQIRRVIASALVDGVGVSASVGVAIYPADGTSSDDLLLAADDALGRSSLAGGNRATVALGTDA